MNINDYIRVGPTYFKYEKDIRRWKPHSFESNHNPSQAIKSITSSNEVILAFHNNIVVFLGRNDIKEIEKEDHIIFVIEDAYYIGDAIKDYGKPSDIDKSKEFSIIHDTLSNHFGENAIDFTWGLVMDILRGRRRMPTIITYYGLFLYELLKEIFRGMYVDIGDTVIVKNNIDIVAFSVISNRRDMMRAMKLTSLPLIMFNKGNTFDTELCKTIDVKESPPHFTYDSEIWKSALLSIFIDAIIPPK